MKEYQIKIKEVSEKTVTVEAENAKQARDIVEKEWENGKHVLSYENFMHVSFIPAKNKNYER